MALICFLVAGATLFPVSASAASKGAHIFVDGVPLKSRSVSKNNVSFVPFRAGVLITHIMGLQKHLYDPYA